MAGAALRFAVLALGAASTPTIGFSHALPGSTLTFSRDDDSLDLTITLLLQELILALPTLAGLEDLPKPDPLPAAVQAQLADYFAAHLILLPADQAALNQQLISAQLDEAQNDDVGLYDLPVVDLAAPLAPDQTLFPLTITYDAVMHEVRNHQATVFVQTANGTPAVVGQIEPDPSPAKAAPFVLQTVP